MWESEFTTWSMRGCLVVPLCVAGAALYGPLAHDAIAHPDDAAQYSHHFNAGTADLNRPPGGWWYEQPLQKIEYRQIADL